MPFKSEAQRRYLYAKHPKIAKRWSNEQKGSGMSTQPIKRGFQPVGGEKPSTPNPGNFKPGAVGRRTPPIYGGGQQRRFPGNPNLGGAQQAAGNASRTAAMERRMKQMQNQKQDINTKSRLNNAMQQKRLGNQVDRKLK